MREQTSAFMRRAGGWVLASFLFLIPFSVAAVEMTFPILLILWLLGWKRPFSRKQGQGIPSGNQKVFWFLGLYIAICAISVVTSSFRKLSLTGYIGKTLEYALMFAIAADLVDQPQACRRAVRALLAAVGLVVCYALLQEWAIYRYHTLHQAMAADPIRGHILDYARMVGPYKNPNDLATFLMFTGLVAAGWLLRPPAGGRVSTVVLFLTALVAGCLIWTQSLGAMLGLFGGLVFLGVVHRKSRKILFGLTGLTVAASVVFLVLSPDALQKIMTLSDVASKDRLSMWVTAWTMIVDHPIWGHGLNTFMANYCRYAIDAGRNPAYAHNCFLQITAETGIVGLITFLLFLTGSGRLIWSALNTRIVQPNAEEPALRAALEGISAALLAFLIQSAFDTNFYALRQAALFWTLGGTAVGMSSRLIRLKTPP